MLRSVCGFVVLLLLLFLSPSAQVNGSGTAEYIPIGSMTTPCETRLCLNATAWSEKGLPLVQLNRRYS